MFANEGQQARVCEAICNAVGLFDCWRAQSLIYQGKAYERGEPTEKACKWRKRAPGWSHGELLMFQFAWCVWNGEKRPDLYAMLGTLDGKNLRLVGSLLFALADERGSLAIDEWLERYGARREVA